MEKNEKLYMGEIDILKAIGIILVVIGHAMPDAASSEGIRFPFWKAIYDIIYSFHMPLFMFASGILSCKFFSGINDKKIQISKRFKRLLVPYFAWGIIYIPFRIILSKYSNAQFSWNDLWRVFIGGNPYSGLWFLYALFIISLIQILIVDSKKSYIICLSLSGLALIVVKYIPIPEPINWVMLFSFLYLIGKIYKDNREYALILFSNKMNILISTFLFIVSFIAKEKATHVIAGALSIMCSFTGIWLILSISCIIYKKQFAEKIIPYVGKNCMEIYILSGPILVMLRIVLYNILGLNYHIYIIMAVIISIMLALIISNILIRRIGIMKKLLIGDWS